MKFLSSDTKVKLFHKNNKEWKKKFLWLPKHIITYDANTDEYESDYYWLMYVERKANSNRNWVKCWEYRLIEND